MKLKEYRPAAANSLKRRTVVGFKVSNLRAVTLWGDFIAFLEDQVFFINRLCCIT